MRQVPRQHRAQRQVKLIATQVEHQRHQRARGKQVGLHRVRVRVMVVVRVRVRVRRQLASARPQQAGRAAYG